jgi:hypothetical protein
MKNGARRLGLIVGCLLLAGLSGSTSQAEPSLHTDDAASSRGREIDKAPLQEMGELVKGGCAKVHVTPSQGNAGHAAISAEVPSSDTEQGDILFCGGTARQCITRQPGFSWHSPLTVTDDEMALSTFIPREGDHVTILRISPNDLPDACMEEITIADLKEKSGHFRMKATGIGPSYGWTEDDTTQLLHEIQESAEAGLDAEPEAPAPPQPQPRSEYQFTRNDRQYLPNLGIPESIRNVIPNYNPPSYVNPPTQPQTPQYQQSNSYQAIAQARADALARNRTLTHNIPGAPPIPGVSEGIGYGPGLPQTCFFTGPLLADAVAQGADGLSYRVRFFNGGQYVGGRG